MKDTIIAGSALRQLAIARTANHILDVKHACRGSKLWAATTGNRNEYLEAERRRLERLRALGGEA